MGGAAEIGKNCTVIEQDGEMVMIDCGLSFPDEEMPGVDIVIPDFTWVLERKEQLQAIILTHAHEDHVGALPYLAEQVDCPIYATKFCHAMIRHKLEEKTKINTLDLQEFRPGESFEVGKFKITPVRVTHSIPDTCAIGVHTQHGIVLVSSDFKFDFTPVDGKLTDIISLTEMSKEGVVLLLSDSTNVERDGWSPSESVVVDGLEGYFSSAKGRVLITTFASNVHRMQQAFDAAAKTGRKVGVVGRRMEQVLTVCRQIDYIKIPNGVYVTLDELKQLPPDKQVILTTGSQGEPMSALVRMSKSEYNRLKIQTGDTVLYSARPIPGNEGAIWRTVNRLFLQGATVIYESDPPIHVSGHGHAEELKMMINIVRPFYVAPIHGEPRHQHRFIEMLRKMGFPAHRVFALNDGSVLTIGEKTAWMDTPVHSGAVLVDSSGTPGTTGDVLRDRNSLAKSGLVTVTVAVDVEEGLVVADPIIQTKGIHAYEGFDKDAFRIVDSLLSKMSREELKDSNRIRHEVHDTLRGSLQREFGMQPLIIVNVVPL